MFFSQQKEFRIAPVISHKKQTEPPKLGGAKVLVVTCRRSCPPNESTDRNSQPTFEGGPGGPAVPPMGRVFCRWWKNLRGWYMLTRYVYIYIMRLKSNDTRRYSPRELRNVHTPWTSKCLLCFGAGISTLWKIWSQLTLVSLESQPKPPIND